MVPRVVFTVLKNVLKASHKPTLPKMRLGRYAKASRRHGEPYTSWGTFL